MKFYRHIIFSCLLTFQSTLLTHGQILPDSLSEVIANADKYALPELHKKAGIFYYKEKDFQKAEMAFRECFDASQKVNDWVMAGNCLNNLGGVAFQRGDHANGILFYRKAINMYRDHHQDTLLGDAFLNLGLAFKKLNLFDSATASFYKGIKILEDAGSKKGLMYGYNMLGNTLREVNSLKLAQQYYMKSMLMAESFNDSQQIGNAYNNLGTLFRQKGVLDSAANYYNRSLTLKKDKMPKLTGNTYYNLAITFMELQNSDSAIYHLKKSNQYRFQTHDYVGLGYNYVAMSMAHLKQGNTEKARHYLQSSDSLALVVNYPPDLTYKQLTAHRDLFEHQEKYMEAAEISKKMIQEREAILNSEKQDVIASYEVRFGVNELQRALEAEENNRRKNNIIYLLTSVLTAFIIFSLVRRNHRKENEAKTNEILYKEMHHRVNNILGMLGGMINHKRNHLKDGIAKNVLKGIGKQLEAINLGMQGLYYSKKTKREQLDFGKYLKKLTQNLFESTGIDAQKYKIDSNLAPVLLTAEQSNPLGLVANEVLTNIIKYGQNSDGTWKVKIDLQEKDDAIELCIKDNGPGFKTPDIVEKESHGMKLIDLLVRKLRGEYSYTGNHGGNFVVRIKK